MVCNELLSLLAAQCIFDLILLIFMCCVVVYAFKIIQLTKSAVGINPLLSLFGTSSHSDSLEADDTISNKLFNLNVEEEEDTAKSNGTNVQSHMTDTSDVITATDQPDLQRKKLPKQYELRKRMRKSDLPRSTNKVLTALTKIGIDGLAKDLTQQICSEDKEITKEGIDNYLKNLFN